MGMFTQMSQSGTQGGQGSSLSDEQERLRKEMEAQRAARTAPVPTTTTTTEGGDSFMSPEQTEWFNMMTGAINQMGGQSDDAGFHNQLSNQYLGLIGGMNPGNQDTSEQDMQDAIQMIQLGEMLGDEEMMAYGQNALRTSQGMGASPLPGSNEYNQNIQNEADTSYMQGQFPGTMDEMGNLTEEGHKNTNLQLQAESNPNLVKQYMDEEPNWLQSKGYYKEGKPVMNTLNTIGNAASALTLNPISIAQLLMQKSEDKQKDDRLTRAGFNY